MPECFLLLQTQSQHSLDGIIGAEKRNKSKRNKRGQSGSDLPAICGPEDTAAAAGAIDDTPTEGPESLYHVNCKSLCLIHVTNN